MEVFLPRREWGGANDLLTLRKGLPGRQRAGENYTELLQNKLCPIRF